MTGHSKGAAAPEPIRIGISSCLLGEAVRFDGGHKRDAHIADTLGSWFEFVPVCPEVAIGLGVPRPPIRLVRVEGEIRVRGVDDASLDVTEPLSAYGRQMAERLSGLSGYILKHGSPSCGMAGVTVYSERGLPAALGAGTYARVIMAAHPLLPCEEEGRLDDPELRERFIERVLVYHRWRTLASRGFGARELARFHTEHKYLILAHDQAAYRRMGRLVARSQRAPIDEVAEAYGRELMGALTRRPTRRTGGS